MRTPSFPSLTSAHSQRWLDALLCACNPDAGEAGTGESWDLLVGQWRVIEKNTRHPSLASIYVYKQALQNMNMYTHAQHFKKHIFT